MTWFAHFFLYASTTSIVVCAFRVNLETSDNHKCVEKVGDYCIDRKLGEGQQGSVYLARRGDGKEVALKEFSNQVSCEHEANILQKLQGDDPHPNVVGFFGSIHEDNKCYIAMEVIIGSELLDVLVDQSSGTLAKVGAVFRWDDAAVAALLSQIAAGLEHMSRKGVFWIDFKLANIMITPKGLVKLVDFGVAATKQDVVRSVDARQYVALPKLPLHVKGGDLMIPNDYAPPECIRAGGCCVPLLAEDLPGKSKPSRVIRGKHLPGRTIEEDQQMKFKSLQLALKFEPCPELIAMEANGEAFNSWDAWAMATLEAFCRYGKKPQLPGGLFYSETGSKADDVLYQVEERFCHLNRTRSCKTSDAPCLIAGDGLQCNQSDRPSLTTLRNSFEAMAEQKAGDMATAQARLAVYSEALSWSEASDGKNDLLSDARAAGIAGKSSVNGLRSALREAFRK